MHDVGGLSSLGYPSRAGSHQRGNGAHQARAALTAVQFREKKKRRLATARTFKLEQRHLGLAT